MYPAPKPIAPAPSESVRTWINPGCSFHIPLWPNSENHAKKPHAWWCLARSEKAQNTRRADWRFPRCEQLHLWIPQLKVENNRFFLSFFFLENMPSNFLLSLKWWLRKEIKSRDLPKYFPWGSNAQHRISWPCSNVRWYNVLLKGYTVLKFGVNCAKIFISDLSCLERIWTYFAS